MMSATLIGPVGVPELAVILGLIGVFTFWLWMLVDCALHEKDGGEKATWILIIVFLFALGAMVYLFTRKLSRRIDTA